MHLIQHQKFKPRAFEKIGIRSSLSRSWLFMAAVCSRATLPA
jgi:hypothetical protein